MSTNLKEAGESLGKGASKLAISQNLLHRQGHKWEESPVPHPMIYPLLLISIDLWDIASSYNSSLYCEKGMNLLSICLAGTQCWHSL